jgi:hypothetical protein
MQLQTVSIGTHLFTLRPDARVRHLQKALAKLIRRGGGLIDVPVAGSDAVTVLVSPGLPVVFRTREVDDDDEGASVPRHEAWLVAYAGEVDFDFG